MASSTMSTSFVSERHFTIIRCHSQSACSILCCQHRCSNGRPCEFIDDLAVHSLTLASQLDLLGLFNTYVTSVSFSVTRGDPMSIIPRLQLVMYSILPARVLLHVRDALQKDLHKTGETNIKFENDTDDTGTGSR
jgi:hypothetical protein